jgi:hypothetical protein
MSKVITFSTRFPSYHPRALETLAQNDGLSLADFKEWFKWGTPFDGQIICWKDNIEY